MSFWAEMLIITLGTLILEPIVFYIIDKFQKSKHDIAPIKVDRSNFVIKQGNDMKGMVWVLGLFLGIPVLGIVVAFPFIYENNGMSITDVIILECIMLAILLVIIALMWCVLAFKAEIRNNELYVYSLFGLKKYDIKTLTTKEKAKGYYKYLEVYLDSKRVLKVNYSMTNYEPAKERLVVSEKNTNG